MMLVWLNFRLSNRDLAQLRAHDNDGIQVVQAAVWLNQHTTPWKSRQYFSYSLQYNDIMKEMDDWALLKTQMKN